MSSIVENNYRRWLESPKVSEKDKLILSKMSQEAKDDAFFQDIEFGTAGMRGVLGPGTNRMNEFTVKKATIAYANYLLEKYQNAKVAGVAISHDNRHLSREFTLESARILNEMGINTYIFDDLRPTPELSFAVRRLGCVGGIMITASHNPKEYNGYKVYDENGCQLVPTKIRRLLDIIDELPDELEIEAKPSLHKGKNVVVGSEIDDEYVDLVLKTQVDVTLDKKGFPIVYTPQHGASYENAMKVFSLAGYEIVEVKEQCNHDPDFGGTLSPNPEADEAYIEPIKIAKDVKSPLILMTDPDGDRCGLAYLASDGTYKRLTGNQSAALLIDYLFSSYEKKGVLPLNGVMYDTIVTSDLGRKIALSYGVKVESFLTGFKYIGERIHHYEKIKKGPQFLFGYEESYGCLVKPFVRDKDGLQAILLYAEMALSHFRNGVYLDEAYRALQKRYGFHENKTVSMFFAGSEGSKAMALLMERLHDNPPLELNGLKVARVLDCRKGTEFQVESGTELPVSLDRAEVVKLIFEDSSWLAVRPSGTEPKCKFYIEAVGKTEEGLAEKSEGLLRDLKSKLDIQ